MHEQKLQKHLNRILLMGDCYSQLRSKAAEHRKTARAGWRVLFFEYGKS